MRCKQGDLAIIVKSLAGNEGKIVNCKKFIGNDGYLIGNDRWEIDILINTTYGRKVNSARDSDLRPIQDSDKQDEMLSIIKIKEKV